MNAAILTTFRQELKQGAHRRSPRIHVLSNGMTIKEHATGWCDLLAQPPAIELGRYRTIGDALAATESF